jgi:dihydroorotate dehydrogenase electron transfer subunit
LITHKVEHSVIVTNEKIAAGVYRLALGVPPGFPCPAAGQFVNIYLNDPSRLLPRPLSVCDWQNGMLTLVYAVAGAGTKQLSAYKPGDTLRVSYPLGNGYDTAGVENYLLVGGGAGVPPLFYLSKVLQSVPGRAVRGFKNEPFLTEGFPCEVEIATDDGSTGFRGNVVDLLRQTEISPSAVLFACGPKPMLRALAAFAASRNLPLQVSLEERMGCGYGACVGCVCKTTQGSKKVCGDGPVFDACEVIWDV